MEKTETDSQSNGQPDERKNHGPAIVAAIVGVVVLVLAIVGLNLAGFISVPLLPKSPEIVLLRAIDDVAHDGTFDLVANADTDAELRIEAFEQEATSNIRLAATATGTAYDFDANDLSKLKIPNGSFTADSTLALDVGFLEGETGNLHAAGTFDLVFAEGEINYDLQEPFQYKGTIQFDPHEFLGDNKKAMSRSIGLRDINNMKMEGDVITFTVSSSSFDTSAVPELLKEILRPTGIDVVDAETNLSDLDVRVDLGTAGSVRARVTGTMSMTARGEKNVDLPMGLPTVPLDIGLKLNVPIDIELVLS